VSIANIEKELHLLFRVVDATMRVREISGVWQISDKKLINQRI
jgi:hypothetical protein